MTAHHVLKTADGKETSLIPPDHSEIDIRFYPSDSSYGAVVDAMTLSPFNKGNGSEAEKDQVMPQDESELFGITPFKVKFLGTALSF